MPGQIIGVNGSTVLLLSPFHLFQICSSGYLVPSKVKQMGCYHSLSAHLILHTHITTIHTGQPPASTYTWQTQTCNIFNSSDFKYIYLISTWHPITVGKRVEDSGCPKNMEGKASSFPKQLGRQVTHCQIMRLFPIKHC